MDPLSELIVQRRSSSIIYRLDPRVRLTIASGLFVLTLLSRTFAEVSLLITSLFLLTWLIEGMTKLTRMLLISAPFTLIIFLLNLSVGFSLPESLIVSMRLVAFVTVGLFFFLTISPDEVEYVMSWLRLPRDLVFASVTAIRFLPILMLDVSQIVDAQRSRGLELETGGPVTRVRNFIPILTPMLINAVARAGELAEAMEARGYGAAKKPTSLYDFSLAKLDMTALAFFFASFSLILYYLFTTHSLL